MKRKQEGKEESTVAKGIVGKKEGTYLVYVLFLRPLSFGFKML